MTVWLIMAGGSDDAYLDAFHEEKGAVFSFKEGGDIRGLDKKAIIERFENKEYIDGPRKGKVISHHNAVRYASQILKIRDEVKRGDYLYTSLKDGAEFLIGRVKKDPYEYRPDNHQDHRHILRTKWGAPTNTAAIPAHLLCELGPYRHTIRTPRQQEELAAYAGRLFA
ncbi:hypothetical protein MTF65_07455 [Streptomyces sp. APSN-46.1]|uniref:hypothetical protein n=1 Tax=Streptomyces sp. APSN-46.1 TaxID=2929049 RepID=UPI001FB2EA39|nr:hypothetical protein [Streptomyces sp. APSN-46.1]MCJ1677179.1 hypothetical protein [Streptomyces sp. APSN-46.1]